MLCCKVNSNHPRISQLVNPELSPHWTSPHVHGRALLMDTFCALPTGPSLSASPSSFIALSQTPFVIPHHPCYHDMVVFLRDPGFLLYPHYSLGEIIQSYSFIYCPYFIGAQMFTADLYSELQTFISTHFLPMAKTKVSIPTPEFVLPKFSPSQM